MNLRELIFGMVAVASLVLAGCGGLDCDAESKCSGDEKRSQSDKDICEKALEGDCSTEYEDVATCFLDKAVCDSDDNTDLGRSADACKTETAALTACCTKHDGAAGCPTVG